MSDRTYAKDVKDPIEVRLPSSDHFLIVLRIKEPRDWVTSAPFEDHPLDLCNSPVIKGVVSESSELRAVGLTYVAN